MEHAVLEEKEFYKELVFELATEIHHNDLGGIDSVVCFAQSRLTGGEGPALQGA